VFWVSRFALDRDEGLRDQEGGKGVLMVVKCRTICSTIAMDWVSRSVGYKGMETAGKTG
jgi:hypothetical protein